MSVCLSVCLSVCMCLICMCVCVCVCVCAVCMRVRTRRPRAPPLLGGRHGGHSPLQMLAVSAFPCALLSLFVDDDCRLILLMVVVVLWLASAQPRVLHVCAGHADPEGRSPRPSDGEAKSTTTATASAATATSTSASSDPDSEIADVVGLLVLSQTCRKSVRLRAHFLPLSFIR